MNIDSRWVESRGPDAENKPVTDETFMNFRGPRALSDNPVRHELLLAGNGERAAITLTRVSGYRRSPRGRQRRPIIHSNTHAPDQTLTRPRLIQFLLDLAAPGRCDLTSG